MLKERIREEARRLYENTVQTRRHLHAHPELSFKENKTAAYVASRLDAIGISYETMANTGLVALLQGKKSPSDKVVALRADMDALPIQELNDVPYRSAAPGVMHACGHDGHTASLLGTAAILKSLEQEFSGTVKFIFQPGEECTPGGASMMIREGVLQNPTPQSVFGQHVMPELETGKIGLRPGRYMASADEIYITVEGKGGHGAMPHTTIDPVLITSHMIVALQQIVSRNANPTVPSVLSFGRVIANGAHNVIPDKVTIDGTFRTMDETWRFEAHRRIKDMAGSIVESMGGKCEVNITVGYPVLINEEKLTARTRALAEEFVGKENVVDLPIWMAAEDFASYSQIADACFYRLGVRNEKRGITSGLHTATFDLDEKSLEIGSGLMAWLALNNL
ncbi:M20 family metallopeptidase [Chitinophaga sp. GCM10012297]|uniref:Amidohydrolase n=1 Tax=Chitinophaga chungangae TaxID=2821488 RepID=A0ABS3YHJ3_9BACT|nr:M20 family metallopeptidase [Chitinophaga chungangae]MBO9154151.1 amidohydrolase [Chitinophaga chungangae]